MTSSEHDAIARLRQAKDSISGMDAYEGMIPRMEAVDEAVDRQIRRDYRQILREQAD